MHPEFTYIPNQCVSNTVKAELTLIPHFVRQACLKLAGQQLQPVDESDTISPQRHTANAVTEQGHPACAAPPPENSVRSSGVCGEGGEKGGNSTAMTGAGALRNSTIPDMGPDLDMSFWKVGSISDLEAITAAFR